jgi:hypothetical protein
MRSIGVLLVVAACHTGGTAAPDAPVVPDGPAAALGIYVNWEATPLIPGTVGDKLTVSDATFQLSAFELIGDAGPGDERTTHSRYAVIWDSNGVPAQEVFPDAPVGMYSKISLDMESANQPFSYQIEGTWRDSGPNGMGGMGNGQPRPFRVIDTKPFHISIDCDRVLSPGSMATLTISVDLEAALESIDFRQVRSGQDGVLQLGTMDQQMFGFRQQLGTSFLINDTD